MKLRFSALTACALLLVGRALHAGAEDQSARYHFLSRCSGCHGVDGEGTPAGGIPQFRNFVGAFANDDAGRTYMLHVPGVQGASLDNAGIAGVMNYLITTWAGPSLRGSFTPFTAEEVAERRKRTVVDVVAMRREIVRRLRSAGIATAEYPWP